MKWNLFRTIVSQSYFVLLIWLCIRNIHRHPQDTTVVDISILSIILFTALCTAAVTVAISRHSAKTSPHYQPPTDPRKERRTQLIIAGLALLLGAMTVLFVR